MLKILERVTKKISSSASIAVTDSVKVEAKKIAQEASPIIFGIGVVAVGLVIFRADCIENRCDDQQLFLRSECRRRICQDDDRKVRRDMYEGRKRS